MTGIASTTANLALWRMQWETLFSLPHLLDDDDIGTEEGCRLSEVEHFGDNPGNLRLFQYIPRNLPPEAPLVVVLHGCTQTAAGYDRGSGWSWLAEREGFAVIFAQQRNENNPRRCFNWFRVGDIERDAGEAASIRQMVNFVSAAHRIDRQRIFVTGLSAGGGMTNVMLATYPEVFAAGAIIAGLPYRAATTVHDALQVMMEGSQRSPAERGEEVRRASPFGALVETRVAARWPRLAVWQGLADDVVRPSNAMEIVKQWTNVHGLDELASEEDDFKGSRRLRWRDADGQVLVEAVAIEHLGHAVPIDARRADVHEQPGPHFADIGMSATEEIARFFGLLPEPVEAVPAPGEEKQVAPALKAPSSRGRRNGDARPASRTRDAAAGDRGAGDRGAGDERPPVPAEGASAEETLSEPALTKETLPHGISEPQGGAAHEVPAKDILQEKVPAGEAAAPVAEPAGPEAGEPLPLKPLSLKPAIAPKPPAAPPLLPDASPAQAEPLPASAAPTEEAPPDTASPAQPVDGGAIAPAVSAVKPGRSLLRRIWRAMLFRGR